ncbi:MAG: hypothetical protein ABI342_04015 [Nitrososphaera sp.]
MTAKEKYSQTKLKILYTFMIVIGGTTVMAFGSATYLTHPPLNYNSEYRSILYLPNNTYGHIDIKFQSKNGLMPYNGITAITTITIPEDKTNTTKFDLMFDNARILNPTDNPQQAEEGKPVIFTYNGTISGVSTYFAKPNLVYYQPGQYEASLFIHDKGMLPQSFGTVITIDSWDSYNVKQNEINSTGLGWMVGGIALISTAPVWIKLTDLIHDMKKYKRQGFYE